MIWFNSMWPLCQLPPEWPHLRMGYHRQFQGRLAEVRPVQGWPWSEVEQVEQVGQVEQVETCPDKSERVLVLPQTQACLIELGPE